MKLFSQAEKNQAKWFYEGAFKEGDYHGDGALYLKHADQN